MPKVTSWISSCNYDGARAHLEQLKSEPVPLEKRNYFCDFFLSETSELLSHSLLVNSNRTKAFYINDKQRLGKGAFADVYLGVDINYEALVVLKKVHKSTKPKESRKAYLDAIIANEAMCLERTGRLISHLSFPSEDYLVMSYVEGLNLDEVLSSIQLSPQSGLAVFRGLIDDVLNLHTHHHCLHLDIKPSNVMVSEPEGSVSEVGSPILFSQKLASTRSHRSYSVTLIDFGESILFGESESLSPIVEVDSTELVKVKGSLAYTAPEAIDARFSLGGEDLSLEGDAAAGAGGDLPERDHPSDVHPYSEKTDVYACAMVLLQLLHPEQLSLTDMPDTPKQLILEISALAQLSPSDRREQMTDNCFPWVTSYLIQCLDKSFNPQLATLIDNDEIYEKLVMLIKQCLSIYPEQRPSIAEIQTFLCKELAHLFALPVDQLQPPDGLTVEISDVIGFSSEGDAASVLPPSTHRPKKDERGITVDIESSARHHGGGSAFDFDEVIEAGESDDECLKGSKYSP